LLVLKYLGLSDSVQREKEKQQKQRSVDTS
jgi:hypothetical protein